MIDDDDMKEINPLGLPSNATAHHVQFGLPIPKPTRVESFSPKEWEQFAEEYASALKSSYVRVRRFGGAGDMGIDVACYCDEDGLKGVWDNFQCKQYDHPLFPGDIWVEIGKVIYYSHLGEYVAPRRYYFCASRGVGASVERLLNDSAKLKSECKGKWSDKVSSSITSTGEVALEGGLLEYFDKFDFTIFSSNSVLEMIQAHESTSYHSVRFGGGLEPRPQTDAPPTVPSSHESRYIRQLLDAYGDHDSAEYADIGAIAAHADFAPNFQRQRERFYHAEALRNFARDTVPEGTFAKLQEEIYDGVADICDGKYDNGFARMSAAVAQAATVASTSNPLAPATEVKDRQGICHQLANEDRLSWVKKNG